MKRFMILLVTVCSILTVAGQEKNVTLAGQRFTVIVRDVSIDDFQTDSLYLFRENGDAPLLSILHKDIWGDCNSLSVMVGDYEVTDSTFVLYHFWAKAGDAPVSPYGARIQTYGIENGHLRLKSGKLYIETVSGYYIDRDKEDSGDDAGVVYLHLTPKNEKDQQEFNAYIRKAEKEYNGKFVYGKEADLLLSTVRKRLAIPLWHYAGNWNIIYKDNGFGYKK